MAALCRRWQIRTLAVFGSAARGNLREESDVDFVVTFDEGAQWSLLDHVRTEQEMEALLGRPVDMVTSKALARSANDLLRREIARSSQTLYRQQP